MGWYNPSLLSAVLELGPSGVIQRQYQLPTEVKCIIQEYQLIYVACGDGSVYGKEGLWIW